MCLAIPGKVISLDGATALIEVLGVQRSVAIDFTPNAAVGDYLMVHAGYAIEQVDMEEAERTIELFRELDALMQGHGADG